MFDKYYVSGNSNHIHVTGVVDQTLRLNADGFFRELLVLPNRRCLDFLRIAASAYAVDRIAKRKKSVLNESGVRQLHLTIEVDDLAFWKSREISHLLWSALKFLTVDAWKFSFSKRAHCSGDFGYQSYLNLGFPPKYLALYSGGLDSAAGLAGSLLEGLNNVMLVTIGHQSSISGNVKSQLLSLQQTLKEQVGIDVVLAQATLTASLLGGKSKRISMQEKTQRSRAFFFCAAAILAAQAYKLDVVRMFENGVGSINLPVMSGMLGNGLATRGAHPMFLSLMSELAQKITEKQIDFQLPNEAKTKAEMLGPLVGAGLAQWAQKSRSCIHTSLRDAGKTHCGICAACIERRQAFSFAGIDEDISVYSKDVFDGISVDQNNSDYLQLYLRDAERWLQSDSKIDRKMSNHLRLTDVALEMDGGIKMLHRRHAAEVRAVFKDIESVGAGEASS